MVLGIDVETLKVWERFEAAVDLAAVATGHEGRVYGVSRDGARWVEWLSDGAPLRQAPVAAGTR